MGRSILINDTRVADGQNRGVSVGSASEIDALIKFRRIRAATGNNQLGGVGFAFRFVDSNNFVEVTVGSGSQSANGNIRERVTGNTTDTLMSALFSGDAMSWKSLRIQTSGSTLKVKAWDSADTEPATWNVTHELEATAVSGTMHVVLPYSAGGATQVQSIALATAGSLLPTGPTKALSGFVKDENDQPVARTVRVYDRTYGDLIGETTSNASTGAFSVGVEASGGYDIIVLDDAGGFVENDYLVRVQV